MPIVRIAAQFQKKRECIESVVANRYLQKTALAFGTGRKPFRFALRVLPYSRQIPQGNGGLQGDDDIGLLQKNPCYGPAVVCDLTLPGKPNRQVERAQALDVHLIHVRACFEQSRQKPAATPAGHMMRDGLTLPVAGLQQK